MVTTPGEDPTLLRPRTGALRSVAASPRPPAIVKFARPQDEIPGVRPSAAAAGLDRSGAQNGNDARRGSHAAAPEDGRAPFRGGVAAPPCNRQICSPAR